jgi:hypothetical protein
VRLEECAPGAEAGLVGHRGNGLNPREGASR